MIYYIILYDILFYFILYKWEPWNPSASEPPGHESTKLRPLLYYFRPSSKHHITGVTGLLTTGGRLPSLARGPWFQTQKQNYMYIYIYYYMMLYYVILYYIIIYYIIYYIIILYCIILYYIMLCYVL